MPQTFTLTAKHREEFDRVGVLRLPGFYPPEVVAPMADALWADLERRYRLDRRRRETWNLERGSHFQNIERSGAFNALDTPALTALADAFLGEGAWERPRRWGQPLVTFPTPGAWATPQKVWHIDYPTKPPEARLAAIRVFVLLEPALSHGGATVFAAGAHQLAMGLAAHDRKPVRSLDMRERLKSSHPWFALLWAGEAPDRETRLTETGADVMGVAVRVEEMIGEPGDVLVMHPNMLHGLSQNVRERPRLALVQSLMRRDANFW